MEPTDRKEDIEVLAHVHLRKEQNNLEHALQAISDWVRSGTGEGVNFLVTRSPARLARDHSSAGRISRVSSVPGGPVRLGDHQADRSLAGGVPPVR